MESAHKRRGAAIVSLVTAAAMALSLSATASAEAIDPEVPPPAAVATEASAPAAPATEAPILSSTQDVSNFDVDITVSRNSAAPFETVDVSWVITGAPNARVVNAEVYGWFNINSSTVFYTSAEPGPDFDLGTTGTRTVMIPHIGEQIVVDLIIANEGQHWAVSSTPVDVAGFNKNQFTGFGELEYLNTGETGYAIYNAAAGGLKRGWFAMHGGWFYADAKGFLQRDAWVNSGGQWYYLDEHFSMVGQGWKQIGGSWYLFGNGGAMQTGWHRSGNSWFYLSPNGAMVTGWANVLGAWYYLDADGVMQVGWQNLGGKWYYLDGSGAMRTGWLQSGGSWYFFNGSGIMQTGWINSGGTWYYFQPSGAMKTSWLQLGSNWYYFWGSGAMATGTATIDGKTNVFASDGRWLYEQTSNSGGSKYYNNCTEVWNDLGRPITSNDPGYGRHLDRDGDGVGCETRPR